VSLLLNIETATTVCSVALSDAEKVLASEETDNGYTHAENLHVFINSVLKKAGKKPNDLSAVAVSKGPGSYTGLRIGVSAAKGLAFALQVPLISIDTLQLMSAAVKEKAGNALLCPMIDARRMEVYTALYDDSLKQVRSTEALIVDEGTVKQFSGTATVFFGNGMQKCRHILEQLPNAVFAENIVPSARFMPVLAMQKFNSKQFEDVSSFEPFYLKEFMAGKKKKAG
jgi:tRNA threonylcarbamoyladenosine biosynthesis protein TsaB